MKKVYVFISQISNTLFQLFIILFITKTESLLLVGVFGLMMAYINPITTVFKLGISQFILSLDDNSDVYPYNKILIFNTLIFISLSFLASYFISNDYKYFFLSLSVLKSGQMIRETFESNYIKNREESKLFYFIFLGNVFSILFFLILYYFFTNLNLSILGAGIILLMFSANDIFKTFKSKVDLKFQKNKVSPLLKITASKFLNSFKASLPRIVGKIVLSFEELGVLTLLQQSINFLDIINNTLLKSNNRLIVRGLLERSNNIIKKAILNYLTPMLVFWLFLSIVLFFTGNKLLELVFNEDMSKFYVLLIWMVFFKFISMFSSFPKISFIVYNKVKITINVLIAHTLLISPFLFLSNSLQQIIIVLIVFEIILFLSLSFLNYKLFKLR